MFARIAGIGIVGILLSCSSSQARDDSALKESLRQLHDKGAELYNNGEPQAAYRLFEGGLFIARTALAHRPGVQTLIDAGLKEAEGLPTIGKKAFRLHEVIEMVRTELGKVQKTGPEVLSVSPRVVAPPPPLKVSENQEGVVGRVLWQGKPLAQADVLFVSLGHREHSVFEAVTTEAGGYGIPKMPPGKYIVLIRSARKDVVIPERYATSTTSPLQFDITSRGEKIDLLLQ